MDDLIDNLFTRPGLNNDVDRPRAHLLDAVRLEVNRHLDGCNVIMLEGSHVQPTLTTVYKNGVTCDPSASNFPRNANILIGANPCQASINLANEVHLADCYVGDMNDPVLTTYRTLDENNSRAHIILDRFPSKQHSFVALVQADPMLNSQSARDKLVKQVFNGVVVYNNKPRQGIGHPHGGYEFFFGVHKHRTKFIRKYAFRNKGTSTSDEVRFSFITL